MSGDAVGHGDTRALLVLLDYAVAQKRSAWADYLRIIIIYFAAENCDTRAVQDPVDFCPRTQVEQEKNIPVLAVQAGCGGHCVSTRILLLWGSQSQHADSVKKHALRCHREGTSLSYRCIIEEEIDLEKGLVREDKS
jgi:hypothetical protein